MWFDYIPYSEESKKAWFDCAYFTCKKNINMMNIRQIEPG